MQGIRALKYSAVFILPITTAISFTYEGWLTFLPVVFGFIFIPIIEYCIGLNANNLSFAESELVRDDKVYDILIYLTVPTQVAFVFWFLFAAGENYLTTTEVVGRTLSIGLMNGVFGINIAHELGHRNTWHERIMAKVMLSTTLFLHFYIEHNRGHHRNVATPLDAATAKKNEPIYSFWIRTISQSFISAWRIVKKERERKKLRTLSIGNEMIQYLLVQLLIVAGVAYFFSVSVLICFLIASLLGILLLETVNYIEHYGLQRKKLNDNRYEDVQPVHSWNSDFIVGRIILFELTRHSDHHYQPSKSYQTLNSLAHSSQLPAGYPAMMLLALLPIAWFKVMNKRLPEN